MISKLWFFIGCVVCALAVAIGAFGAHGLKNILVANQRIETFETAVKYHFYHGFAIIVLSLVANYLSSKNIDVLGITFLAGIAFFSGSLYALCLTNMRWLGAVTPLGGIAFILAWVGMGYLVKKSF